MDSVAIVPLPFRSSLLVSEIPERSLIQLVTRASCLLKTELLEERDWLFLYSLFIARLRLELPCFILTSDPVVERATLAVKYSIGALLSLV